MRRVEGLRTHSCMEDSNLLPRHDLSLRFLRLMIVMLVVVTVLRPMVVELDPLFTYLGVLNVTLCLVVYGLVRADRVRRLEGELILALGMICILPLLLVSGGVNSQFAYLIPIYPLAATILSGNRLASIACAVWLVVIGALTLAGGGHRRPDRRGLPPRQDRVARDLGHVRRTGRHRLRQLLPERLRRADPSAGRTGDVRPPHRARQPPGTRSGRRHRAASGETQRHQRLRDDGDVDHFKQFNDRHGHGAGDRCLQAVARCLRQATRAGQDLVGRCGGEEFLVILSATDADAATGVAEKLRAAVASLRLEGADPLSVTIGVASLRPGATIGRDELIGRADRALYEGKAAGRNRVVHADRMADPV